MLTKCAKLTSCEEPENKKFILYHAKACDGDEIFSFLPKEKDYILPGTCPVGSLVEAYYNPEHCLENHSCVVDYMMLASDNQCAADCGVF